MNDKLSPGEIDNLLSKLESTGTVCVMHINKNDSVEGFYITNSSGQAILVNNAYEKITGFSKEDSIGQSMDSLAEKNVFAHSVIREVLKKEKSITTIQQVKGNKKVVVTVTPIFDKKNEIALVVTNIRKISELNTFQGQNKFKIKTVVGKSPCIIKVMKDVTKAAKAKTSILLLGETGVGKSMLGRIIHQLSGRIDGPFIKINCGAIPYTLMESELFGYQEGAFTGASNSGKTGLIEAAHKGTVFFDEIGELAQNMQVKLLEVIENKTFVKLGSHHSKKVDANIIAATNKNLKEMVAEKTFREDLYYRLNVFPIHIPPLRERKEDIPELAFDILAKLNKQKKCFKQISPKTIDMLTRYSFPGNVRELINIVERMFILCEGDLIDFSDLPEEVSEAILSSDLPSQKGSLTEILARIESQLISTAVSKNESMAAASKELGIHTTTLWRKAQKYGII